MVSEVENVKPGIIAPKEKRHIRFSDEDMPGFKGNVGSTVTLTVSGQIAEASRETEWDDKEHIEKPTGHICYRLEIDSFGKKSKRIDTTSKEESE